MTAAEVQSASVKAHTLVEALPYIRNYRGRTVVVKIGGEALCNGRLSGLVAEDIALMVLVGIRVAVVHGGGPQVSDVMNHWGIEPVFVGGLRVTDERAIEIVQRVLVGTINVDLVGELNASGLSAVGLSGGDGETLVAEPVSGPNGEDLGRVGRIASVRPGLLKTLLGGGYTPVIAPIAPGPDGGPFNVNADAVAGSIAAALEAEKLVYLTNVEGLYRDLGDAGSLISELKVGELEAMIPSLSQGMRPKAESAAAAVRAGVDKVHVLDGRTEHALLLEVFTDQGIGTQVLP